MVRQDAFREYRALDDVLTEREQSGRGRMATVVESDGHMVMVETATSGGAIGPYPATVSGLSPGASGVLEPLRGNQALFIATGVALDDVPRIIRYTDVRSLTIPGGTAQSLTFSVPGTTGQIAASVSISSSYPSDIGIEMVQALTSGNVNVYLRNFRDTSLSLTNVRFNIVVTEMT